jgi:hypothetical protein
MSQPATSPVCEFRHTMSAVLAVDVVVKLKVAVAGDTIVPARAITDQ